MSDFFDFTERYLSTDGKEYIDANCVRKALGIVDEHVDILGVIKKLREERDGLKADLELTNRLYKENRDFVNKVCEAVDIQRPYFESGYANAVRLIAGFKRERDEFKEKYDKLKARANATYGVSCGKAPAFRCNVISYSWNFGLIAAHSLMDEPSYPISSNSIRVELDLTPTANYKGTFDWNNLEDLKRYIQDYGREKKLSDFEIFCKLVDNCIDELCDKYNVVQPDRSQTTRGRLDYIFKVLVDYRELANNNFNKAEGFRKEKRAVEDSLAKLRAKVREIYRSVVDDEWDAYRGHASISALNDINEEYKRVVHNFEERTADWSKAQQELDRYRFAVGSLLDIPKEDRDDINAIERSFTFSKKKYESLKEFRDNVCEILDIPSSMADEQVLKELHDVADRYDELENFRVDICGALDIVLMLGTPQQNDKYILAQAEKLKDNSTSLDRYARFRSNICTALCLGGETDDEDILKRVRMTKECHDALCKDYTKLHEDYIDSQKQLKDFTNRCDSLEDLRRDLCELRRNAIEDLKSRGFCFRPEENETLPEIYDKLLKRYDWAYGSYKEQYRLRQMWHVRWESENERANGEHKRAEKLRKDVAALTNRIELFKLTNASQANSIVASQAFKNECRKLKEEKAKVIAAIGQEIWDDCLE